MSTYVQLLKTTYAAVKSVNPSILVGAGTLSMPDTTYVWITETGFSTCQASSPLCVSTAHQSQWLSESFQMMARWSWVSLALVYTASDTTANTSNWNDDFELMYYGSLLPKPSLTGMAGTWSCLHAGTC